LWREKSDSRQTSRGRKPVPPAGDLRTHRHRRPSRAPCPLILTPAPESEAGWSPSLSAIPSSNRPASLLGSADELLDMTWYCACRASVRAPGRAHRVRPWFARTEGREGGSFREVCYKSRTAAIRLRECAARKGRVGDVGQRSRSGIREEEHGSSCWGDGRLAGGGAGRDLPGCHQLPRH